jgi:carbonic anhydrase
VHRNLGNVVSAKDLNVLAAVEYGVTALRIKHIIVAGHYNCGAIKAALDLPSSTSGLVNLWIQDIRNVRDKHADELLAIADHEARADKLTELNVAQGMFNIATSQCVSQAWGFGQEITIHGLVYTLKDGILREICAPITGPADLKKMLDGGELLAPSTSEWYSK